MSVFTVRTDKELHVRNQAREMSERFYSEK